MGFLERFFGSKSSKEVAKDRLRLVLINDRIDISPELLDSLRHELIGVITRYVEVDEKNIEMQLGRDNGSFALSASIPVLGVKRGSQSRQPAGQ